MRLIEDGTYIVDVTGVDLDEIKRVMLDAGKYCKLLYPDKGHRRGKWIPWRYHDGFKCEKCNEPVDSKYNFCPNCGADMRGNIDG